MPDEIDERDEAQDADSVGSDPEVPLVPHFHDPRSNKLTSKKETQPTADFASEALSIVTNCVGWIRRHSPSSNGWTAVATIFIALATIIYAIYAIQQWAVMLRQLGVMEGQLKEMQDARQPWVGVSDIAIRGDPKWESFPTNYVLHLPIRYGAKNFGNSPAFRETNFFTLVVREDTTKPMSEMQNLCTIASRSRSDSQDLTMIFPGTELAQGMWFMSNFPTNVHHIQGIWFIGCFIYEDSAERIHHTKYWFIGASPGPQVAVPGIDGLTYAPFSNFTLYNVEAD